MNNILSDQLEIWGFEKDNIVYTDGSFGFGLELQPLDVTCLNDNDINALSTQTIHFLNSLANNLNIQFIQDIKGGNQEILRKHKELGSNCPSNIINELTENRISRLEGLDNSGFLPMHTLKVFVRYFPENKLPGKSIFCLRKKLFVKPSEDVYEQNLLFLERIKNDILESISALGLMPKCLSINEVIDLIYEQWNPTRKISLSKYDSEDVRSSLVFTDLALDENGFSLGGLNHKLITLKILPDQTYASMAAALRSLPFDSRLFFTIHAPDQQKELESLQTQRRLAFSMVTGRKNAVSDIDAQAKLTDLETLLEQMVAEGEKVFHASLHVLLRSKDSQELDMMVSQTLMKIRELGGAEGMCETLATWDVFKEVAIPHARVKERARRMKTSNLADFLPIFGPWPGHKEPSVLLRSRMGSLISFDPFSSHLTNANMIVSGGSGSGKSFMCNILLLQMMKENPQIFIIDIGGSYKKLCETLGGQYIPLSIGSDISINPFDLKPGETSPDDQKIKFLVGLVELMTKEDSENKLPKLERAEVEAAILQTYAENPKPKLSDLKKILASKNDPLITKMARVLEPWCGNTPYGQFLDKPFTISLSNSLVCFDLKGLESHPDLQAVCLFIITDLVWRKIQEERSTKKFLVFDECWRLLENDAGSTFIGSVFRTFRKYNASAIAISQNIDDFARSKIATAVMPNSSVKWVLKQKGADRERLKEVLDLNETESALVDSLQQERGVYSEAFLMAGDQRSVVAVESTPLEYWIATTDPRDLRELETKNSQGKSLQELAEKYPRGVAAKS